ncbi:hypothetical protein ACIQVT_08630 [Streptomyces sp. NPDC100445]|uniref:hypothetical protein n=1 Tax=Streptomyces sp. NPDC100445 TaxID=3366102 RepID=UPI0038002990
MGRRRGPRPGVRFLVCGLLAAVSLCATGCDGPAGPARPHPGTATGTAGAARSAVSDTELCVRIVVYWSRRVLDDDTYGDYQSMGLSHGQYRIVRDVVDAARTTMRRQGAAAARELIDRRSRRACTLRHRHGPPREGPWA